jgi:hypothetical protein
MQSKTIRLLALVILASASSVLAIDLFRGKTGALLDNSGLKKTILDDQDPGTTNADPVDPNAPPSVTITSGPSVSTVTNISFSIVLSVDKDSGYWSTNNSAFTAFSSGTFVLPINNPTKLMIYGKDISNRTSSTQTIYYVRGTPGLRFVLLPGNEYSVWKGAANTTKPVVIPNSFNGFPVTTLKKGAFQNATGLTNITIPASVLKISTNAFAGCTALRQITLPASLDTLGPGAFSGCTSLIGLSLPTGGGVTTINSRTFFGCTSLKKFVITDDVSTIGPNAFQGCTGLTNVRLSLNADTIASNAFYGCTLLKTVQNLGNYKNIGPGVFGGCIGLVSAMNLSTIETIGNGAFAGCTGIPNITIGNNATYIGASAFQGCTGMTSATIDNNALSLIGDKAFYACSSLASVTMLDSNPNPLGTQVFDLTHASLQIHVPGNLALYKSTTNWSSYSNKIVSP